MGHIVLKTTKWSCCGASRENWTKTPKQVQSHWNHLVFFPPLFWLSVRGTAHFSPPTIEWQIIYYNSKALFKKVSTSPKYDEPISLWGGCVVHWHNTENKHTWLQTWCHHSLNSRTAFSQILTAVWATQFELMMFLFTPHGTKCRVSYLEVE